jgi:O-antigen/teichoic acid export membrane protein
MLTNNIIRQIFTQFFGLVTGLVTSVITARILGPEGRGEFSLILNTANLLTFVFGFSLGTSVIHVLAGKKMPERRVINSGFAITTISLLLFFIIGVLLPKKYYHLILPNAQGNTSYIMILILLLTIALFTSFFSAVLTGKKAFKQMQLIILSTSIITVISYLVFYYTKKGGVNVESFSTFYLILYLLPLVGFYLVYFRYFKKKYTLSFLNAHQLKYLLGFSFMAYLSSILHFLSCRMDFWIVEYFKGSEDLGYYSLASNLSQMLWIIPQAIASILITYASDGEIHQNTKNTNLLTRVTLTLLSFIALFLFFVSGFIIPFLFGTDYNKSILLFQLLLIGVVPFSINTILASFFVGIGSIKTNLFTSFISFIICLILDVFLIPKYGVKGATIASIIAYILSTLYIVIIYIRTTKIDVKDLLLIKKSDVKLLKNKIGLN